MPSIQMRAAARIPDPRYFTVFALWCAGFFAAALAGLGFAFAGAEVFGCAAAAFEGFSKTEVALFMKS